MVSRSEELLFARIRRALSSPGEVGGDRQGGGRGATLTPAKVDPVDRACVLNRLRKLEQHCPRFAAQVELHPSLGGRVT